MFLERRFEAKDGTLALNVFRRTDDLYEFRLDRFRPPIEGRDAYWAEGFPLSGLYQTADEAESAARATAEWRAAQQPPQPTPARPAREPLTNFYQVLTDPYAGIRSQDMIDWENSRASNRAGPFIAPHIPSLGIKLTSLGSGFPRGAPPDRIIYKLNPKRPVRDFENASAFWIISEPARDVLLRFASDSIDLAPAQVLLRHKDGKDIAIPQRHLCDVIRFEDVVDEVASEIQWGVGGKQYGPGSLFAFKSGLPPNLHLFRLWKWPRAIVCSAELRMALEAANLRGVAFGRLDIHEYD